MKKSCADHLNDLVLNRLQTVVVIDDKAVCGCTAPRPDYEQRDVRAVAFASITRPSPMPGRSCSTGPRWAAAPLQQRTDADAALPVIPVFGRHRNLARM